MTLDQVTEAYVENYISDRYGPERVFGLNHGLLTAEREKELGRAIQEGDLAIRKIVLGSYYGVKKLLEKQAKGEFRGRRTDKFSDNIEQNKSKLEGCLESFKKGNSKKAGKDTLRILSQKTIHVMYLNQVMEELEYLTNNEGRRVKGLTLESKKGTIERLNAYKKHLSKYYEARNELIENNLRLVSEGLKRYNNCGVEIKELFMAGIEGLMRSAIKFNYDLGNRFSSYATQGIKNAMLAKVKDHMRNLKKIRKCDGENMYKLDKTLERLGNNSIYHPTDKQLSKESGVPFKEVKFLMEIKKHKNANLNSTFGDDNKGYVIEKIKDPRAKSPFEETHKRDYKEKLMAAIETLDDRSKDIVLEHSGLKDGVRKSFKEIGDKWEISKERARQVEARALFNLRKDFKGESLGDFVD